MSKVRKPKTGSDIDTCHQMLIHYILTNLIYTNTKFTRTDLYALFKLTILSKHRAVVSLHITD